MQYHAKAADPWTAQHRLLSVMPEVLRLENAGLLISVRALALVQSGDYRGVHEL